MLQHLCQIQFNVKVAGNMFILWKKKKKYFNISILILEENNVAPPGWKF